MFKKGSENGAKMEPRSEKTVQGAHFGRYESIASKSVQKEARGELQERPRAPGSRVWVPLIKETTEGRGRKKETTEGQGSYKAL